MRSQLTTDAEGASPTAHAQCGNAARTARYSAVRDAATQTLRDKQPPAEHGT
jgi:hypothetical protein